MREVAQRVFAEELSLSNLMFKESDDPYAPNYMLTQTGAKCNRVLIMGTLVEKTATDDEGEYFKIKVSDPTGAFYIYAGQYNKDAARAISQIEAPAFVAITGKPQTYETKDGDLRTTVRPEHVTEITPELRDFWVAETIKATAERVRALKSGSDLVRRAMDHYNTDAEHMTVQYREMLRMALNSLKNMEVE
jgi:RPA family protein